MARLTIYRDDHTDCTVVPNCFIDEYIKDANDAQLKVYLYLLRMLNANEAVSVSDIADKFNHTEKDILRALKYWEGKQLLSLDYDGNGSLNGIRLHDITKAEDSAVSCESLSPGFLSGGNVSGASKESTSGIRPSYEKPSYTTQQLRDFKEREDTAQLLFIAQSYLGRPLTPTEMKSILFMMDVLHFSEDLIDYLIQYCVDRGKKDFKYIEKVAINWAEQGITTPKQAQTIASKYDKNVYAIMNRLGKSNSPTAKEMEFINRWTKEWEFDNDIIFEACERTVLATDKHRFEYADSILSKWKKEDVHRRSDIIRMDEMYQAKRRNCNKAVTSNKFNQFAQNSYDFDQLERELISN